jgi:hypothetical protein
MKNIPLRYPVVAAALLLYAMTGCREVVTSDRSYQRVLINNFSAPIRTILPPNDGIPSSLKLRISGTISQPVMLAVDLLNMGQGRSAIRRDTLAAGTYANKLLSSDFYSRTKTELIVTGKPGTTGSLTIEWSAQ